MVLCIEFYLFILVTENLISFEHDSSTGKLKQLILCRLLWNQFNTCSLVLNVSHLNISSDCYSSCLAEVGCYPRFLR